MNDEVKHMFFTRTVPTIEQLINSHAERLRDIRKRLKDLFRELDESPGLKSELKKLEQTQYQDNYTYRYGFISWYREYEAIVREYEQAKNELMNFIKRNKLSCKDDITAIIESTKETLKTSKFYPAAEDEYQKKLQSTREKNAQKVKRLQNSKAKLERAYDRRHPSCAENPIELDFYLGAFGVPGLLCAGMGYVMGTDYLLYHIVDKLVTTLYSWKLQYKIDNDLSNRTAKIKQEIKTKNQQTPGRRLTQEFFKCEKNRARLSPEESQTSSNIKKCN